LNRVILSPDLAGRGQVTDAEDQILYEEGDRE
jgi:hypothetical protein